jgi:ABC-type nitrate/sulfonate/bicarbonate transport system substrate-binding protein
MTMDKDHAIGRRHGEFTRRHVLGAGAALAGAALLPFGARAATPLAAGKLSSMAGGLESGVSAGAEIPKATFKLGIEPYGDHSILVIGIRKDFYKDVGLTIDPAPLGESIQGPDVVPRLATGALDAVTWYAPLKVAAAAQTPNITMLGFHDIYIGTYILAAPWTKAKKVTEFLAEGKSFADAMGLAAKQMIGKRVALANDGAHRDFFGTVFTLGGVSMDQVELQALPDNEQVQLGNSQRLDFASPSGAAQTVQLMNQGWYSMVGTEQLLAGLPKGDQRAVATIGNTGPACTLDFIDKNYEKTLRFVSVQYRIVDAIKSDPDGALSLQAPYLQASAGTNTSAKDLGTIMSTLDPLFTFEDQAKFWTDESSIFYYKSVLQPQIDAAKAGGLIPDGVTITPDDITVGAGVYKDMVKLKTLYEGMLPKAGGVSGAKADMVKSAADQYKNRNYLDAYRMLKTATAA